MSHSHTDLMVFAGRRAASCSAANHHSPTPLRFVWHHILPQAAGGRTAASNLASVCDSCHYAIHALLYQMACNGGELTTYKRWKGTGRYMLAKVGYNAALAAGVLDQIPNEGSD